jgi:hypothetical protein
MIRVTLMDGSRQEIRRDEVVGIFPFAGILSHPLLRSDGILYFRGRLIPVQGPLPDDATAGSVDDRPWLMVLHTHAQAIRGLPAFNDEITLGKPVLVPAPAEEGEPITREGSFDDEEARLLQEMEELLKSA